MKRILAVAISAFVLLVAVAFVSSKPPLTKASTTVRADEGARCSLGTAAGIWGFTTNGTVVGIGPRASVGIFTLDAAGDFLDGKVAASSNGSVTHETASGTYTVNRDCTGTLAIGVFDQSGAKILTLTADIVFDNNVRELRAVFTSAALPDGTPLATVITAQANRVFSEN